SLAPGSAAPPGGGESVAETSPWQPLAASVKAHASSVRGYRTNTFMGEPRGSYRRGCRSASIRDDGVGRSSVAGPWAKISTHLLGLVRPSRSPRHTAALAAAHGLARDGARARVPASVRWDTEQPCKAGGSSSRRRPNPTGVALEDAEKRTSMTRGSGRSIRSPFEWDAGRQVRRRWRLPPRS